MAILALVRLKEETFSWPEVTGPVPDWDGPGEPPIIVLQPAGSETIREPKVNLPGSFTCLEINPRSNFVIVYSEELNEEDITALPSDIMFFPEVLRTSDINKLGGLLKLTPFQRNRLRNKSVGEVLSELMEIKVPATGGHDRDWETT